MDLMDVPEPGASADPWGAGAGAGAAASADPWQSYGTPPPPTHTPTVNYPDIWYPSHWLLPLRII